MARIDAAVGPGAPNHSDDVLVVQLLLERHQRWLGNAHVPEPDGRFTPETARAILGFQGDGAALLRPDGVIKPNGFSFSRLNLPFIITLKRLNSWIAKPQQYRLLPIQRQRTQLGTYGTGR